jgi:hypothetical protein
MLHAGHAWRLQIGFGTYDKPLYTIAEGAPEDAPSRGYGNYKTGCRNTVFNFSGSARRGSPR